MLDVSSWKYGGGDGGGRLLCAAYSIRLFALYVNVYGALLNAILELLVPDYPYEVPTEGMFSYLPRLLGRAKVC